MRFSKRVGLGIKRTFDLFSSALLLAAASPLIAVIALMILIRMGPPVFFRQERLGWKGKVFTIYKFRTMTDEKDQNGNMLPDAERLTKIGAFLRKTTLDELPELWNVFKGDMSAVGPRPLLVEYRDLYTPEQWRRHDMPPGMAGPVLASGRNTLSWEDKFAKDLEYIDHWSLALDIQILFQTLIKVLKKEGTSAAGHATMPKFEGSKGEGTANGQ